MHYMHQYVLINKMKPLVKFICAKYREHSDTKNKCDRQMLKNYSVLFGMPHLFQVRNVDRMAGYSAVKEVNYNLS